MTDQDTPADLISAAARTLEAWVATTTANYDFRSTCQSLELETSVRTNAVLLAQQAFRHRNLVALDSCHRILNRLIGARVGLYSPVSERAITCFAVEQILINEFIEAEAECVNIPEIPSDLTGIVSWWREVQAPYLECPHPLFRFLKSDASPDQYRAFLLHDLGIHVPFDDALASLVIGTRGEIRAEILANLLDELGVTKGESTHMTMATEVAAAFDVDIGQGSAHWQALACANALMVYCHYRSLFPEAVGYLGCLETLTPARFRMLGCGGERVGIDRERLRYYFEHTEVDDGHAEGWLQRVIIPLVRSDPKLAGRIRLGVSHRLNVSQQFWNSIFERIRNL